MKALAIAAVGAATIAGMYVCAWVTHCFTMMEGGL